MQIMLTCCVFTRISTEWLSEWLISIDCMVLEAVSEEIVAYKLSISHFAVITGSLYYQNHLRTNGFDKTPI